MISKNLWISSWHNKQNRKAPKYCCVNCYKLFRTGRSSRKDNFVYDDVCPDCGAIGLTFAELADVYKDLVLEYQNYNINDHLRQVGKMKRPQDSTHKYNLEFTSTELRIINASLTLGNAMLEASIIKWSKEKINVLKKLRKEFDKYENNRLRKERQCSSFLSRRRQQRRL